MTKKILVVLLLSLTISACEPASTETSNGNTNASPAASTPAPISPEPGSSVKPQVKAGDKVKVTINGSATEATVVSVDEKSGKVTVKVEGQKEEKKVALTDVVKN